MSVGHQLSLEDALRAKEAGIGQALEHAEVSYRDKLYGAIQRLADSRRVFCADDLREIVGNPPIGTHPNLTGAVVNHAAKAGLIRTVGFTRSARVVGHQNIVRLWKGEGE